MAIILLKYCFVQAGTSRGGQKFRPPADGADGSGGEGARAGAPAA
jgi:hypothetical protein